jgi:hypothetical protein
MSQPGSASPPTSSAAERRADEVAQQAEAAAAASTSPADIRVTELLRFVRGADKQVSNTWTTIAIAALALCGLILVLLPPIFVLAFGTARFPNVDYLVTSLTGAVLLIGSVVGRVVDARGRSRDVKELFSACTEHLGRMDQYAASNLAAQLAASGLQKPRANRPGKAPVRGVTTSLLALTVGLVASLSRSDNRWPAWLELATRVLPLLSSHLVAVVALKGWLEASYSVIPSARRTVLALSCLVPGEYLRSWLTAHTVGRRPPSTRRGVGCHPTPLTGWVAGCYAGQSSQCADAPLYRGLSSTDAAARWPSSLGSQSHTRRPIHCRLTFFWQSTGARSGGKNRLHGLLVIGTCLRPVH